MGQRAVVLSAVAGTVGLGLAQAMAGPVDPPPGPPMPTMPRLGQIERIRCIHDMASFGAAAKAVMTITEPCRYCLTPDVGGL